jgi:hypothetical protein
MKQKKNRIDHPTPMGAAASDIDRAHRKKSAENNRRRSLD